MEGRQSAIAQRRKVQLLSCSLYPIIFVSSCLWISTYAMDKKLYGKQLTCGGRKVRKISPEDDLICPITLELPLEPVVAEDGIVYEKNAIEKHIQSQRGSELRSPYTNKKMGMRLLPAYQHKNLTETLVKNGCITDSLARTWTKRMEGMELLKDAEAGDKLAMCDLSCAYRDGTFGFEKNLELAFSWVKRAHKAEHIVGTAFLGDYYLQGIGVEKCFKQGLLYTALAATKSDVASYHLGMGMAEGRYDMQINTEEAVVWLQKCVDGCAHKNLSPRAKSRAKQKLEQLKTDETL